jgi:hypothetical protein
MPTKVEEDLRPREKNWLFAYWDDLDWLWKCTCGEWNAGDRLTCQVCRKKRDK